MKEIKDHVGAGVVVVVVVVVAVVVVGVVVFVLFDVVLGNHVVLNVECIVDSFDFVVVVVIVGSVLGWIVNIVDRDVTGFIVVVVVVVG